MKTICNRIGVLLVVSGAMAAQAQAQDAALRVNQVGYATHAPKRAYLMSKAVAAGSTFKVRNGNGDVVFARKIAAEDDRGAWGSFPHVYVLHLSDLERTGRFTITVDDPVKVASPEFPIDSPAELFRQPLANALFFYENQRDGPHFIRTSLRTDPAHLNDRQAKVYVTPAMDEDGIFQGDLSPTGATIDASGGWADAGDYLKFVQTHSYTVGILLTGVRDFPEQMGEDSRRSDFTREVKFGLDWLQKMWDDRTQTLYYQVGIGNGNDDTVSDHDIWRLPQDDDEMEPDDPSFRFIRNRPVFINTAGGANAPVSPNLAGRLAASFALCFQVFKHSDRDYARDCMLAAEHVFDRADTNPAGQLLTAAPFGFYPEDEWRDDLEWGATELYFALANSDDDDLPRGLPHKSARFYLEQAAHWANAYITGPNDAGDTISLSDVSGLAHFELVRAIRDAHSPRGLEVKEADLIADIKKELDAAVAQANKDPFGFGFRWNQFDTTTHGTGMSMEASEYDFLTKTRTFERFAHRWLGNVLGGNAWGVSLIVGDGTTFPHCMQHQIANLVGSLDGTRPVLRGAAVEGPNSHAEQGTLDNMLPCPVDGVDVFAPFNGNKAVFRDNVESFSTVEPAIDLTASGPLAFAWLVEGGPEDKR
jgi:endoglucanase